MKTFRIWFYAAAAYNVIWGALIVLFPLAFFRMIGADAPNYPGLLQVVGMMVGVYGYGYWLMAKDPVRFAPFIWIGLAGKTFGPLGFLYAAWRGELPWAFGWTILTNDLIWWPVFWAFAIRVLRGTVEQD